MTTEFHHDPVLLDETITQLGVRRGAIVLDGTLGGGGHAVAILERSAPDGLLIGIDVDRDATTAAAQRLARYSDRVHLRQASFRDLESVVHDLGFEQVDAVLFDLGLSSHQIDTPARGFRFSGEGTAEIPLDMRLDQDLERDAASLLRSASRNELERCFREYGELRGARRLANTIERTRRETPFETAADLVRAVDESRIGRGRRHNPATLVFQALRIAVNDELEVLRRGLAAAVAILRPGGRIVVMAYHSLEDRIVKTHFRDGARSCTCPPQIPVCVCGGQATLRVLTRRPLRPSAEEIQRNPRARSARLRAAERLEDVAA
ncbi:MAG: 16S rRNA (cytosine(1402)-N(4))-methyltransferase RsmH [Myxococcota bacterium]